jgi:hypothetical protein
MSWTAGTPVTIAGCKPAVAQTANGNWTIASVTSPKKIRIAFGYVLLAVTDFGKIWETAESHYHVITRTVPRPKTWYQQARVRAIDKNDCAGDWSAWTTPLLPWTGADPKPPTPTYTDPGSITYTRQNRDKHVKLRLHFTFNDMSPWDVPGGDHEDDLHHYIVELDRSDDGVTWDGRPYRHQRVHATFHNSSDPDDTNATRTAIFGMIRRRFWYRCRVRSVDRFNRPGDWSAWTTPALPFDDTQPPQPLQVTIYGTSTDRVVIGWDDPTIKIPTRGTVTGTSGTPNLTGTGTKFTIEVEAGSRIKVGTDTTIYTVKSVTSDTAIVLTANLTTSPSAVVLYLVEDDPDVAFYGIQIAKAANIDTTTTPDTWSAVYAFDRSRGNRKAFKIPDADAGFFFGARVRSVDAAFNRSKFVPARITPNDDPNADAETVGIGKGAGKTKVLWSVLGKVRVLTEAQTHDWDIDEALTLAKFRLRAKVAPQGQAIIVSIYKNGVSQGTASIAANARRGANNGLAVAYADTDALSFSVDQVGSTFPGRNLTAVAILS